MRIVKPGDKDEKEDEGGEMTPAPPPPHWTHRHGKPIVFVILTLVAVGVYLAFTIPVAVFPETNFPRIIIGVDNGVMPIEQMVVTITRPIEEAVNTVPGLEDAVVGHQPRLGRDRPVLQLERRHVPDAAAGQRRDRAHPADLPSTAQIVATA